MGGHLDPHVIWHTMHVNGTYVTTLLRQRMAVQERDSQHAGESTPLLDPGLPEHQPLHVSTQTAEATSFGQRPSLEQVSTPKMGTHPHDIEQVPCSRLTCKWCCPHPQASKNDPAVAAKAGAPIHAQDGHLSWGYRAM